MKFIALFFVIFSLLCIVQLWIRFRRGRVGTSTFFVWVIIWVSFMVFAMFPSLLDWFMHLTMMTQRMNFAFVMAIFVLLVLVNRLFEVQKNQSRMIRRLSQKLTLLKYTLEYKNHKKNDDDSKKQ